MARRWRRTLADFVIACNVSPRQLADGSITSVVETQLRVHDLPAGALRLEVTETALVHERAQETLEELHALGVSLAIDDFGTGYSSLASLMRLPIDVLKIDRAFIATMLDHAESSALVHLLIEMGRTLHLEVVAEGVERPEQAEQLRRDRCDHGQGFLFARPLPDGDFRSFVTGRRVTARR